MKQLLMLLIRAYQLLVSPLFSTLFNVHCRYDETCSRYFARMLAEKGLLQGCSAGIRRVLSCNPWSMHG